VIAIEDAGRYRDGLGVALPVGVPEVFTEPVADPLGELLGRYARTHGPFPPAQAATRLGLGVAVASGVLDRLTAAGRLVRGELRPDGMGTEYCDAEVLRRVRRSSLARLRAEVEPVEQAALGRFLPAWHGIGSPVQGAVGAEDVLGVVEQLAGVPLPASAWETLVLPARLPGYSPALLDELTAAGEVTWTGCGGLAGGDGWLALAPTDVADLLLPEVDVELVDSPLHRAVLVALEGGALFFRQLADRAGATLVAGEEAAPDDSAVAGALWDLVWAGLATNDTLAPVRAMLGSRAGVRVGVRTARRPPARGRYARMRAGRPAPASRAGSPTVAGRWSAALPRESDPTRRAAARAEVLLERHGVFTRAAVEIERVSGGFAAVYKVLRAMEDSGRCRRGYVVEGLGGAQFAVPGAIDRLRAMSRVADGAAPQALLLAATDPAQPWGAALQWPTVVDAAEADRTRHRPGRKAGAVVVLVDGRPALYLERGGRSLLSFTADSALLAAAARCVAAAVADTRLGPVTVERVNGHPVLGSELGAVLTDAGFRATPKGMRLRR